MVKIFEKIYSQGRFPPNYNKHVIQKQYILR